MSGYPDSPEIAMAGLNHLMNQSQNNVAAVLKVNNSTELYPSYNTPQTAVSLVNIQKPSSYRNNTTWGNQLAHTPLSLGWRLGCSASPVWDGGWGAVVCLSGPGVCVILAVCQSGLGNGHRVITPALTASSISLYHPSTPHPKHTLYLFPFSSAKEQGKEKKRLSGRTPQNTTETPEKPMR